MSLIALFISLVFLYSLVSGRLERTVITAPIVATVAGMLAFPIVPGFEDQRGGHQAFLFVAEIGLVQLLFTDACRTDRGVLKRMRSLPVRLLSTGMLLTILLGGLGALAVFPGLSVWEAGILAAILAPTDAGLGQVIVNSPRVPMRIRQALNVEAGLNDGLAVPFLLFFIGLAGAGAGGQGTSLTRYIAEQLGGGTLIGAGIGLGGGWLLGLANRRGWMAPSWQQLGVVSLPLLCVVGCGGVGGSMFIAAFVAGLAVQVGFREAGRHSVEFAEHWGQLLNFAVFFFFGLLVARARDQLSLAHGVYAVLSLTAVRMLPVAMALRGTRLSRATVLFIGWFGPRGLASIVLGLVYLEQQTSQPGGATIRLVVLATVLLSIFAHGLTAMPGIDLYARKLRTLPQDAPELEEPVGTLQRSP